MVFMALHAGDAAAVTYWDDQTGKYELTSGATVIDQRYIEPWVTGGGAHEVTIPNNLTAATYTFGRSGQQGIVDFQTLNSGLTDVSHLTLTALGYTPDFVFENRKNRLDDSQPNWLPKPSLPGTLPELGGPYTDDRFDYRSDTSEFVLSHSVLTSTNDNRLVRKNSSLAVFGFSKVLLNDVTMRTLGVPLTPSATPDFTHSMWFAAQEVILQTISLQGGKSDQEGNLASDPSLALVYDDIKLNYAVIPGEESSLTISGFDVYTAKKTTLRITSESADPRTVVLDKQARLKVKEVSGLSGVQTVEFSAAEGTRMDLLSIADGSFNGDIKIGLEEYGDHYYGRGAFSKDKLFLTQAHLAKGAATGLGQVKSITLAGEDFTYYDDGILSLDNDSGAWGDYKNEFKVKGGHNYFDHLGIEHTVFFNLVNPEFEKSADGRLVPVYTLPPNTTIENGALAFEHGLVPQGTLVYAASSKALEKAVVRIQAGADGSRQLSFKNGLYMTPSEMNSGNEGIRHGEYDQAQEVYAKDSWIPTADEKNVTFTGSWKRDGSENVTYKLASVVSRTYAMLEVKSQLKGLTINPDGVLRLGKTTGAEDEGTPLNLEEGISGTGNLEVTEGTTVWLAGNNAFSGTTTVKKGAELHLVEDTALKNSRDIILEAGSTFDAGKTTTSAQPKEVTSVTFRGAESTDSNHEVQTFVKNSHLTAKGKGNGVYILQEPEESAPAVASRAATAAAAAGTEEGLVRKPHHIVDLVESELTIDAGAVLYVNTVKEGTTQKTRTGETQGEAGTDIAVLRIGNKSKVTIQGSDGNGTSSHAYVGNGVMQVDGNGTLVFGKNSAIHYSRHMPGFFEHNGEKPQTDFHHHASIELVEAANLSLQLDEQNHIYAENLLTEGHQHFLIKAIDNVEDSKSPDGVWYEGRNVTVSMTKAAVNRVLEDINTHNIPQDRDGNSLISDETLGMLKTFLEKDGESLAKDTSLTDLKAKSGLKGEDFHKLLGALVTLSMDNNLHDGNWQIYNIESGDEGVWMTVNTQDWNQASGGVRLSLQNLTNESVDARVGLAPVPGANSGAYPLIVTALETYTTKGNNDYYSAARTIDSAGQIATVAGAQTIAWDMLQNRRDAYSRQRDRAQAEIPVGESQVWADVLSLKNNSDDLWNDLNGDRAVDTDLYGLMMGHDFRTSDNVLWGASVSFLRGESKADLGGALLPQTQNEIESFGASVHGAWTFDHQGRFVWDAAVQNATNDITMTFPGALASLGSLKADADTWAVQLRGGYEYDFRWVNLMFTPYASLQYTWLRTGSYTSTINGLNAFHTEAVNQHIGSVPVGLKLKADFVFEQDRIIRPWLDVYVQPNFGDTEAKNVVTAEGLTSTDVVRPEVIGEFSYGASAGVRFITGTMFSSTLSYSFNGSDKSRNHAFLLNGTWKF